MRGYVTAKNPPLYTLLTVTLSFPCFVVVGFHHYSLNTFNEPFLWEPISVNFLWQVDQSQLSTSFRSRGGACLLRLTTALSQSARSSWQKPLWRHPQWPIPERGRRSFAFNTPRDPPQRFPGGESAKPEVRNETRNCYFYTRSELV